MSDVNKPIIITKSILERIAEEPLHQYDPDQWMIAYKALSVLRVWIDKNDRPRRGFRLIPPMRDTHNFFYYKNKWKEELNACVDPSRDCGRGLHLATKSWLKDHCYRYPWFEAHFQYKDIACVPRTYLFYFDGLQHKELDKPTIIGKFRVFRFKLGKQIEGKV
jgi:hypothetical protein